MPYVSNRLRVCVVMLAAALPASSALAQRDIEPLQQRILRTVREMGTVESSDGVEIRCEVPGQSTILWVAEEGASVKPGDELLRLDTSAIEKQIAEQRIQLSNAKVAVETAKAAVESLQLRRETAKQTLALQKRASKLAREATLGKEGSLQQEVQEALSQIKIGEARLAAVAERIERWRAEHGEKDLPAELKLLSVEANEALVVASRRRAYLEKVLKPSEEAKLDVEQSRLEMKLQAEAIAIERDLVVAKSELAAADVSLDLETTRHERLLESLKNCVIKAPQAGTVVHHHVRSSRGASGFVVEPGATVRERQTILKLPDLSKLHVRTLVNETRISQVRPGQPAVVQIDALPDEKIRGVVKKVARTAEPTTFLQQNVKNYAVIVELVDPPDYIRLGMTALVEIQTQPTR